MTIKDILINYLRKSYTIKNVTEVNDTTLTFTTNKGELTSITDSEGNTEVYQDNNLIITLPSWRVIELSQEMRPTF